MRHRRKVPFEPWVDVFSFAVTTATIFNHHEPYGTLESKQVYNQVRTNRPFVCWVVAVALPLPSPHPTLCHCHSHSHSHSQSVSQSRLNIMSLPPTQIKKMLLTYLHTYCTIAIATPVLILCQWHPMASNGIHDTHQSGSLRSTAPRDSWVSHVGGPTILGENVAQGSRKEAEL